MLGSAAPRNLVNFNRAAGEVRSSKAKFPREERLPPGLYVYAA